MVTHVQQITGYDQAAAEVKKVDGIVVTGGQDINPDLYGEEHSPCWRTTTRSGTSATPLTTI